MSTAPTSPTFSTTASVRSSHRLDSSGSIRLDQPKKAFFKGHWDSIKQLCHCIHGDFRAVTLHDPAIEHSWEVFLLYNGFWAIMAHRFLHLMWLHGFHLLSRLFGMWVKFFTGIEIHPAADIGPGVFIDHGTGVVIGQTTVIGPGCMIYQGVTLGGTGAAKGKRHPTLGRRVVVGSGSSVLGPVCLGDFVKVGAGSVVTRDVPTDCTVVGIPGRYVRRKHVYSDAVADDLDHGALADPNSTAFKALYARELLLESMFKQLGKELAVARTGREKMGVDLNMFAEDPKFREDAAQKAGLAVEDSDEMDHVTQAILRSYLNNESVDVLVDGAGI